jgi:uncharacterized protein (TIGR02284 family)
MNATKDATAHANPVRTTFADLAGKDQRRILTTIDELRAMCLSAQAGYEAAANEVEHDAPLRDLFRGFAAERRTFADELRDLLVSFRRPPRGTWMARADLHRLWIDLRAFLEHHDPTVLISECERGENAALAKYEAALKIPLSLDVEEMLLDQAAAFRNARAALDRMRHPW